MFLTLDTWYKLNYFHAIYKAPCLFIKTLLAQFAEILVTVSLYGLLKRTTDVYYV